MTTLTCPAGLYVSRLAIILVQRSVLFVGPLELAPFCRQLPPASHDTFSFRRRIISPTPQALNPLKKWRAECSLRLGSAANFSLSCTPARPILNVPEQST